MFIIKKILAIQRKDEGQTFAADQDTVLWEKQCVMSKV